MYVVTTEKCFRCGNPATQFNTCIVVISGGTCLSAADVHHVGMKEDARQNDSVACSRSALLRL